MVGISDFAVLRYAYSIVGAVEWFLILFPGISAVLAIATSLEYARQARRVPDLHFDSRDIEIAQRRHFVQP